MAKLYPNITATIGNTPLVKLNALAKGLEAEVYVKCEYFNPLSSVKDRIGIAMIEAAEKMTYSRCLIKGYRYNV